MSIGYGLKLYKNGEEVYYNKRGLVNFVPIQPILSEVRRLVVSFLNNINSMSWKNWEEYGIPLEFDELVTRVDDHEFKFKLYPQHLCYSVDPNYGEPKKDRE